MRLEKYLRELESKLGKIPKIGFFGAGVSNLALLSEAVALGYRTVMRSDGEIAREVRGGALSGVPILTGADALSGIDEDVLILSPSIRREARQELLIAAERGVRLTSDAELFFLDQPSGVYAVSGSDGKSTTATLAHALLSKKHPRAELVGNIGVPFCRAARADAYVAELSSFQLRYLKPAVEAAIITSISKNHLDWHRDFDEYVEVKLSLAEGAGRLVLPADDAICRGVLEKREVYAVYSARLCYTELKRLCRAELYLTCEDGVIYTNGAPLVAVSELGRREWYNVLNLMGAICLTWGECEREHVLSVGRSFRGLSHRCEAFLRTDEKEYVNSSIDTSPARTAATLLALDRPVSIILGGRGKHLPLGECLFALEKYAVRIALYGEAGEEYLPELTRFGICSRVPVMLFPDFRGAVDFADLEASGTVLLSPAATGYGEFRDYKERGEVFKKYITDKYGYTRKEV